MNRINTPHMTERFVAYTLLALAICWCSLDIAATELTSCLTTHGRTGMQTSTVLDFMDDVEVYPYIALESEKKRLVTAASELQIGNYKTDVLNRMGEPSFFSQSEELSADGASSSVVGSVLVYVLRRSNHELATEDDESIFIGLDCEGRVTAVEIAIPLGEFN